MLILVRHGQTEANARGLLLGRADPPLSGNGCRQARALAATLPRPARIVSSPLRRARETAAVLADAPPGNGNAPGNGARPGNGSASQLGTAPLRVEVDDRWVEMDYGTLDGRPASALDPDSWRTWREDPDFVPAGGESLAAVGARVRQACAELAAECARQDVVVVSHVSPIKAAIAWALGVGDEVAWRMFLDDAAVCRIDTSGQSPVMLAFNGPCRHAGAPDQSVWLA